MSQASNSPHPHPYLASAQTSDRMETTDNPGQAACSGPSEEAPDRDSTWTVKAGGSSSAGVAVGAPCLLRWLGPHPFRLPPPPTMVPGCQPPRQGGLYWLPDLSVSFLKRA